MTALLTDNLPLLAGAPNGIKKLRELILELAVRGKLLPQDPGDEPASELLKRIAEEKARLVAEGKIKKQKPLASIHEEEKLYELPMSWVWGRLGDLTLKITDGTHHSPTNKPSGDYKYISAKNIKSWGIDLSEVTYVTEEIHQEIFSRCDPSKGDILYIKDGATTGIATINSLDEPFSMLSSVALLKPSCGLHNEYMLKSMVSPVFYREMRAGMTGVAITRVTLAKLNNAVIPLPPLAEQHRIVAQVDELMALCDRLETRQADAESAHSQLIQALLGSLTQAADAEDFAVSWQRLAEHFHTLFTTESSIDALKQSLLQLAVMGKLVPQDPSDEPASELCKSIEAEKLRLVAAKKIKDTPRLEPVSADEELFAAPSSWVWGRMGDICRPISSGSTPPSELFQYDEGIPFLKVYNIRNQEIDFEYKKQFVSLEHHAERMKRSALVPGDVVMNIVGPPLGKVAIIPDTFPEWNCNQAIVFFGLIAPVSPQYIYTFLKEGSFLKNIALIGTAGQDNISVTKSKNIAVPLPPLAEQHRIVAKVDQLMALCDQLKARLNQARRVHEHLANALVEQAVA
ncbi:restriction endonuclease subunit S [Pseudomonas pseudonitroreducens]|uniref:restriction endonuclease subunit S n=1 Tax=Pseudomonas pseudonitroreducens TaxID=2892326 RepID=UPI001F367DDD|nr:restriction endonuclease subunit S [Pseudomonas pseudonitroreducens]